MTRCTSIFGDASLQQLNQEIFSEVWELMSCERRVISKNTVVNMKKWAGRPVYYIYIYIKKCLFKGFNFEVPLRDFNFEVPLGDL